MKKILVALQTFGEHDDLPLRLLNKSGTEIKLNKLGHRLSAAEVIELGCDCEGILAGVEPYDREVLNGLTKLECLSRCGVGLDNIDLAAAKARGVAVLNTPEVVVQPVAEMTLAMIFDLLRSLTFHTGKLRSGKWEKRSGHLLRGRKAGIIGLGRIGKKVALLLNVLGAEVYGFDISPDKEWALKNSVKLSSLPELLKKVEILTIHAASSKDNPLFLGREELEQMREGAILVNTSRGKMVDEGALYDILKSGRLGGAGLDVFSEEPYKGPLLGLDNVILTPHISTLTVESRAEMEKQAVENLINYFKLPVGINS
jgi:D-3-phosphoglycerate dehydrogenase